MTQSTYERGLEQSFIIRNKAFRRLTINECKKVMGFSIKHKVSIGVQDYQQLGNAVIPAMIGYIYDSIKRIL
ncbi:MAG: DNA cytosine methyltransferase [Endomicrobium sp.]|nr:DNA cytosine methyltransferase [Endomicrobium sp.]